MNRRGNRSAFLCLSAVAFTICCPPAMPAARAQKAEPDRQPPPVVALRSSQSAEMAASGEAVIREPSQGRPIFITPDETFYLVIRLPAGFSGDVSFHLRHAREPGVAIPLRTTTPPSYFNDAYCHLVLQAPRQTAPGLYDVEMRTADRSFFSRRSVRIIDRFKTRFRFVQLSGMNVGDLSAPEFDAMLPHEINLIGPEFIVATGDYTEWSRALDDATSWKRVLRYFESFDAPVYLACGVHDHQESFTTYVANSPLGTIDYGDYHGLLLLDHSAHPVEQDAAQLQWIEADLKRHRNKLFNFLVSNSNELGLFEAWRERGSLAEMLTENRVRMIITGGSTDWDFREFAHRLSGLSGVHYIRTHQSSTCLRDRATGFSHYRAIEVDGDEVSYIYPDDNATERLQHSIPTGRLRVFYDGPNDGSAATVTATVQNALNRPFEAARVWLRIKKAPGKAAGPAVAGGTLVRAIDAGTHWGCEIACDLPEKGAVRIMAAADPSAIPAAPALQLALDAPAEWRFSPRVTQFGLRYFESDIRAALKIVNPGEGDVSCWPVIRLNGSELHADFASVPRKPVKIAPGQTLELPLILNLRKVSPGMHQLQVYFLEDPLARLTTFDVQLSIENERITGGTGKLAD